MNRPFSLSRPGLAGVCAIALLASSFAGNPAVAQEAAKRKVVEVALCLDTSSSMDGLITSAKQKLWDIVNDLTRARPLPDLRVAVFSYGNNAYDPKTGWVRQELELTSDLDRVSEKLFALQATKVANSEEYVGRVCRDAVDRLAWSKEPRALRVVFVCGNESATQDPDVPLQPLAEAAVRKGLYINTIYCGNPGDAHAPGWKELAQRGEGEFVAINQDRGLVSLATPFDKELAELSGKLNTTFCFVGKDADKLRENQRQQDANALRLSDGAAASRAESKAGGLYRFEEHDLVERLVRDPKFDVARVPVEELPAELKKLTPPERDKHVRDLLAKRQELQKQINELAAKRETHIQGELKRNASASEKAFDEAVRATLREQAKRKGIEIPK
jgi:hypothetical protein